MPMLVSSGFFVLFIDVITCTDEPCQNGGTCSEIAGGTYVCDCPCPYEGNDCELYEISKYQLNLSGDKTVQKKQTMGL
jgi:hypothetical protein